MSKATHQNSKSKISISCSLSTYFLCNLIHFETTCWNQKKQGFFLYQQKVTNTEDETWQLCFSCLRPWGHKGASLLGSDFGLVGGFSLQFYKKGGSLLLVSQSASVNFSGAQTHNAESVDVANSPGTWFVALSTQGVLEGFRCEVSRERNNNMLRCWEWEDYISWKIYLQWFFFEKVKCEYD